MDQAEPEDKVVSGNQQECRADSNLGGDLLLPPADLYQVSDEIRLLAAAIEPGDPGNAV